MEKCSKKCFEGDLIAEAGKTYDYVEITGSLDISADAKLPALTSVGGSLYIRADAKLPALTSVGGYLYIRADAKLPALTSVGGYLDISADAKLQSSHVKKNDATAVYRCRAILMSSFAASGFSFADGILARIVSKRGPVSRVVICGQTRVSYLVTDGESWSHGETLEKAREGLLYKIGSRDTTEFKAWTLDREVTKRDAIRAYRAITGACEQGVRSWMEQHQTPEKVTVREIIKMTAGAYGSEPFNKFFNVGEEAK